MFVAVSAIPDEPKIGGTFEKHYGHLAPSYVADTIRAAFGTMGLVEPDNVSVIASKG